MDVESTTVIDECIETTEITESGTKVCPKLLGDCVRPLLLRVSLAALYFFGPGNPVVSIGVARFTPDCLLELFFTVFAVPCFAFSYLNGVRNYPVNLDFHLSETLIDFMFMVSIVWIAVGNGIHLTAKLDEQMVAQLTDVQVVGLRANFHWIRQVVGHVFPHIGWQLMFTALMLGQLRRPYLGREHKIVITYCGILFGVLFAHGAIAGACTHLGFVLTLISLLTFSYLSRKSGFADRRNSDHQILLCQPAYISPGCLHLLGGLS